MQLDEKNYDRAKWFVTIFLPAFGAFYAGLSELLSLPSGLAVVGTSSLIAVFLGTILGISNSAYKKEAAAAKENFMKEVAAAEEGNVSDAGYIAVTGMHEDTGIPNVQLTMTKDPAEFVGKDTVTLKVGQPPVKPA